MGADGAASWLLLIVPGLIWGASFLFIAEALRSLGPNGISFARICIGFFTLAFFPQTRHPVPRRDWKLLAVLGVIWFAFPLSMFPFAEQRVSSALTGMLNGATPLFATLVACYLARRPPSRGVFLGLAVGLTGTVLIALPGLSSGHNSSVGVLLILAALVSYGFALNLARSLQQRHGALPVIWRAQGIGALLTLPLGVPDLLNAHWRLGPSFSLLALGTLGTGIAYLGLTMAAGRFGAARASSTTFLIPVVALALGLAVRGEHVALLSVLGSAVCLSGAALIMRASGH